MTPNEILQCSSHRPWILPTTPWNYYQEWNNVVFLHWQVDLNELRTFVPTELEIDLFDGSAWVSLVAFTMENVSPRYLPDFAPISTFDEINIRTYVKHQDRPGVYFLSIEGGNRLSCLIAKTLSGLPYRYSNMRREESHFQSWNKQYSDSFELNYRIGQDLHNKTELDQWLTEKYALFQDDHPSISSFDIHHMEWPIQSCDLQELTIQYPRFTNLIGHKPDLCHYSKGVQVLAWNPTNASFSSSNVQAVD